MVFPTRIRLRLQWNCSPSTLHLKNYLHVKTTSVQTGRRSPPHQICNMQICTWSFLSFLTSTRLTSQNKTPAWACDSPAGVTLPPFPFCMEAVVAFMEIFGQHASKLSATSGTDTTRQPEHAWNNDLIVTHKCYLLIGHSILRLQGHQTTLTCIHAASRHLRFVIDCIKILTFCYKLQKASS